MPEKNHFPRDPDKDNPDVFVPSCDLFEIRNLPNLGNGLDINYILDRDGCYLGLIQRKEITRLDAKYMIRVAEERGLFGATTPQPQPTRRKRTETAATPRRRRKANGFEVERIAAPTYASLSRSSRRGSAPAYLGLGCAHEHEHGHEHEHAHEHDWELQPDGELVRVCSRHARRQAAAAAITAAACTCDAKHRLQKRRASASESSPPPPPSPPCRRPFPLVVHDLRLKNVPHKIVA